MLRKLLVGSAVAALVGGLVFGHEMFSYLRTGAHSVRKAVKAEVPIEFELERARNMVEHLVPDIRHCMHVIAEQQVEVEHLQQQIARREGDLGQQKDAMLTLRNDLDSGKAVFVYASHTYSTKDVKRDLATRFERYKAAEEILKADQKILAAREQNLKANQDKLQGLMQSKKELEVKLEQLQARMETIRAAETVSNLAIDDSQLSQARKLIDDLNKQLDIKQKVLDAEGQFTGLIPVESPETPDTTEDIGAQIDAYFSPQPADAAVVVTE
uniref:Signal peptide-containing protein n=1 Tax=Schlesneria paludicola TaxID=360056 RepID=A0A7C2JZ07_9PLAN